MLNLIIDTRFLDKFLLILCFCNIIVISINMFKEKSSIKNNDSLSYIKPWAYFIQRFWCTFFSVLVILVIYKFSHNYLVVAILTIFILRLFVKTIRTDIFNSTLENKFYCVFCSFIIINFFIYDNYSIYLISFQTFTHSLKEILLILFIVLKMITYTYFIILNISIVFSFLKFSRVLIGTSKLISLIIEKEPILFSIITNIENKISSSAITLKNALMYFLIFPLFFLSMFFINLLLKIVLFFINKIISIVDIADKYTKNSKFFVWVIIKVSLITSLVFTYFVVISSSLFSEKVINAYNYLSTVILIPILLDSFHEITKKIRK